VDPRRPAGALGLGADAGDPHGQDRVGGPAGQRGTPSASLFSRRHGKTFSRRATPRATPWPAAFFSAPMKDCAFTGSPSQKKSRRPLQDPRRPSRSDRFLLPPQPRPGSARLIAAQPRPAPPASACAWFTQARHPRSRSGRNPLRPGPIVRSPGPAPLPRSSALNSA